MRYFQRLIPTTTQMHADMHILCEYDFSYFHALCHVGMKDSEFRALVEHLTHLECYKKVRIKRIYTYYESPSLTCMCGEMEVV